MWGFMSGPRLISESIPRVAGQIFSRKYIMLGRLVTRWEEIVGADLAGKAQPVKIRRFKNKDGSWAASLDIAASTADATLLHYRKDLILERINQIFGEKLVNAIRFVPIAANTQKPPPIRKKPKILTSDQKTYLADLLEGVDDPEMQEKLKNLGTAILQDK